MDANTRHSRGKAYISNLKASFSDEDNDRAAQGVVPTMITIAGFAVITSLAIFWIGSAIAWETQTEALCVAQADGYSSVNGAPSDVCVGLTDEGPNTIRNQINATKEGRF